MSDGRRARLALALVAALAAGAPRGLAAQATASAAAQCAAADPLLHATCLEGALAFEAARGAVGLAAALGDPTPGSTSTVGRRIGSSPRIALSGRAGAVRAEMPDPRGPSTSARAFWAKTVEGDVAIGVFDGFSPLPTVGGMFSVDLTASIATVLVPSGAGFDGSLQALGYGARIGVVRESFTLPGVTVSASRRHLTETRWGTATDRVSLVLEPTVSSLRVVAGKDLLAFGVLGGWGWDRYAGRGRIDARETIAGVTHAAGTGGFAETRQLWFGGLSYTFLVLQLSAEGGWASGWATPAGGSAVGYDPGSGSPFGSVAARLTW